MDDVPSNNIPINLKINNEIIKKPTTMNTVLSLHG